MTQGCHVSCANLEKSSFDASALHPDQKNNVEVPLTGRYQRGRLRGSEFTRGHTRGAANIRSVKDWLLVNRGWAVAVSRNLLVL